MKTFIFLILIHISTLLYLSNIIGAFSIKIILVKHKAQQITDYLILTKKIYENFP